VAFSPQSGSSEDFNMATLCMLDGDGAMVKHWEVGDVPVIIGRSTAVDVKVDDEGLSRRHFMIVRQGTEYLVRDLSSRNGTWVHGHRAAAAKLRHNDCILAGRTLFRFCEDRESVPVAPELLSGPHGTRILSPPLAHAA
jgi:pSer/pThr/pTyr-binding forkhead associated (FHA) protein